MRPPLAALLASVAVMAGACAGLSPADRAPRADPLGRLVPTGPSPWTRDFDDPVLAGLLRRADAGALDIKLALARLERANAQVEAAAAARGPLMSIGADAAVGGRTLNSARSAATPALEATYDADLWGRLRRAGAAARSDRQAAAADVRAARLLVGAETARAYLALRAAQAAREQAAERSTLAATALVLAQARTDQGAALAGDLAGRRRAVAEAAELTADTRDQAAVALAKLAALAGQPDLVLPAAALPAPAPASASASSALVDGRPDVQAALARLAAADARRAGAIAASRPQFMIVAAMGAPDATVATLLDVRALAWAAAGTLRQALFDGGARRAEVRTATAEADLADIAYRQAVLAGWTELRDAVTAQARALRQLAGAQAAFDDARAATRLGEARHAAGAADGVALVALREAQATAGDALRLARLRAAEAEVEYDLAAGGG